MPDEIRTFKTKAKNAQEAHEAIRPTSVTRTPESLKGKLDEEQLKLYTLIWRRTMACQMVPAMFDTVALEFTPGETTADAPTTSTGCAQTALFSSKPGFMAVYHEGRDDSKDDDGDRLLPEVAEGDVISLDELRAEQHFTEPPPRFTEASLVKTLEEYGIGRPSTYASIIATLKNREYVEMDGKRFIPTDIGRIVNGFLTEHFHPVRRLRLHGAPRGRPGCRLARRERPRAVAGTFLEAVPRPGRGQGTERHARAGCAGAGTGYRSQERQTGDRAHGSLRPVRADRHQGRRRETEVRGPASRAEDEPTSNWPTHSNCSSCRASSVRHLTAKPVSASIGRFGPYVRYGDKYVSIRGDDDPYTIELPRALELIAEKKIADANRIIQDFEDDGIQVLNGRYGPYITDKTKNARVPKDREPKSLTLEECKELLAAAPARGKRGKKKAAKKKAVTKKAAKKKAAKKKAKKKAARKKTAKKKPATTQS